MRAAPAHLESKLRFWDLSVGQIAAAFAGIMLGVAWAKFLSPLHGMWGAMSGAYIAALPVVPVFVASQTELDLGGLLVGAIRWRRLEGRYLPGAGETAQGYLLFGRARRHRAGRGGRGPGARAAGAVGRGAGQRERAAPDQGALVAPSDRDSTNDHDLDHGSRAWLSNGRERR